VCRLIDADALKADYGMAEDCKDCKTGYRSCQYDNTYTKMDFCGWIDDAPTVDAVPVRKGQWITNKYNQTVCSECISPALEVETGCLVNRHLEPYKTHFCPNCGAYMRWE